MPELDELELDAIPDKIVQMIDSGIADFSSRTLLTSSEVIDLLLDIRLHITQDKDTDTDDTQEHILV